MSLIDGHEGICIIYALYVFGVSFRRKVYARATFIGPKRGENIHKSCCMRSGNSRKLRWVTDNAFGIVVRSQRCQTLSTCRYSCFLVLFWEIHLFILSSTFYITYPYYLISRRIGPRRVSISLGQREKGIDD